jgi:hypothetical protein
MAVQLPQLRHGLPHATPQVARHATCHGPEPRQHGRSSSISTLTRRALGAGEALGARHETGFGRAPRDGLWARATVPPQNNASAPYPESRDRAASITTEPHSRQPRGSITFEEDAPMRLDVCERGVNALQRQRGVDALQRQRGVDALQRQRGVDALQSLSLMLSLISISKGRRCATEALQRRTARMCPPVYALQRCV